MATNNAVNISSAGLVRYDGTGTFTGVTVTNHALLVGAASNGITSLGVATTGKILQGVTASDPAFSTATYPSVATGTGTFLQADGTNWVPTTATFPGTATSTGTILRANGTNWVATTATYPTTTTANQLLFSSATNTISEIATANSGVLTTSSAGVPSIDTTNFHVLTTGVQTKGNNTNTSPPAGFIGELLTANATGVALTNNTAANITSVSLTDGIWDVSGLVTTNTTGVIAGTTQFISVISATTASLTPTGENGVQQTGGMLAVSGINGVGVPVGPTRVSLAGTTTIYLNARAFAGTTFTNVTADGVIRAVRVG